MICSCCHKETNGFWSGELQQTTCCGFLRNGEAISAEEFRREQDLKSVEFACQEAAAALECTKYKWNLAKEGIRYGFKLVNVNVNLNSFDYPEWIVVSAANAAETEFVTLGSAECECTQRNAKYIQAWKAFLGR